MYTYACRMELTLTIAKEHAFSGLQKIYDQNRPRYPPEALRCIIDLLKAPKNTENKHLLDVGCGTGILTRQLHELTPETRFTGCDINADMLSQAKESDRTGQIRWRISSAEDLPFAAGDVNLITVAQAAQWFDRPKFYREVQRVLAAYGTLVIIENNREFEASAFMSAYESLIEKHNNTYSRHYRRFDYAKEMQNAGFSHTKLQRFPWVRLMSQQEFVELAKSSSKVQAAIRASDGQFLTDLQAILALHYKTEGAVTIEYTTQVFSGHL